MIDTKRVNEQEMPIFRRQMEEKGLVGIGGDYPSAYVFRDKIGNIDSNKNRVVITKVPTSIEDERHVKNYRVPGEPFRNNQFLTKTVPATAGIGAAAGVGALSAYVYNLIKDKSKEK